VSEARPPERPWFRDPTKLVPVIVGLLAIGGTIAGFIRGCAPDPPDLAIEYVVDVSHRMNGDIGKKNKLRAVAGEIVEHARGRSNAATALRLAGGAATCSNGDAPPPTVRFHQDNGDRIEQALRSAKAGGKSDFAQAMTYAVNDFLGSAPDVESESKTIYLFVGGQDTCADGRTLEIVRGALRDLSTKSNVDVTFKFVGVKPPAEVSKLLRLASRQAKRMHIGAEVVIADTPKELARVLPDKPTPQEDEYP
jgi:hypothetical protein